MFSELTRQSLPGKKIIMTILLLQNKDIRLWSGPKFLLFYGLCLQLPWKEIPKVWIVNSKLYFEIHKLNYIITLGLSTPLSINQSSLQLGKRSLRSQISSWNCSEMTETRQFTRSKPWLLFTCSLRVLAVFSVGWEPYSLAERGRGDPEGLNSAAQYHLTCTNPMQMMQVWWPSHLLRSPCLNSVFEDEVLSRVLEGTCVFKSWQLWSTEQLITHKSTLDSTEQSSGLHGVLGIWALSGSASGPFPPLWHSASLFLNWRFQHELHSAGSGTLPSLEMLKG